MTTVTLPRFEAPAADPRTEDSAGRATITPIPDSGLARIEDDRGRRIAVMRSMIAAGRYRVPAEDVADAILRHHLR